MKKTLIILFSSILLAPMAPRAISAPAPVSTAVFDVDSASPSLKDRTAQFSALLFAGLSTQPGLALVERSQIDSALGELSMGASGLVDPSSAAKLGRLTGAKVLVLARAVGTTGEMTVANSLSDGIAKIISGHAGDLLPPTDTGEAREARLRAAVAGKVLPAVTLAIPEQHITRPVRDPAAQTEIARILIGLGFPVYDLESADKAAIRITGEAVSEQGSRHGDFVSCRARVEVKVVEVATGRVLLQDSQTEVAADISEVIAAKTALEHAGAKLADRIVAALAH